MAACSLKCGSVRRKKWRLVLGSADLYVGIVLLKWLGKLDLSAPCTGVLGMVCSRAAALTRIGVCVCVCVCVCSTHLLQLYEIIFEMRLR